MKYFNRTINIDGFDYPFQETQNGISSGKNISIQNIGYSRPVVQVLGNKENTMSVSIIVMGKTPITHTTNMIGSGVFGRVDEPESKRYNEYVKTKNRIEALRTRNELINVILPDGEKVRCLVTNVQARYEAQNKTIYTLDFIVFKRELHEVIQWKRAIKLDLLQSLANAMDGFNNAIKEINSYVDMAMSAVQTAQSVLQTFKNATKTITGAISRLNQVIDAIKTCIDIIADIAKAPGEWYKAMKAVVDNAISLGDYSKDALKSIKNSYSKNYSKSTFKYTEVASSTTSITTNNAKIDSAIYGQQLMESIYDMALYAGMTEIIANMTLETNEDVKEVQEMMQEVYDDLMSREILTVDLRSTIFEIKRSVDSYLSSFSNEVKNIVNVEIVNPDNLMNIVYNRYGNLDYYYEIMKLNEFNLIDIMKVQGVIKLYG